MFAKILRYQKFIIVLAVIIFWLVLLTTKTADFTYWMEFWWMFPVAFIIALTVNTLGISGAALFVPFFILVFPFFAEPMSAAQSVRIGLITESFGLSSSALAFLAFGLVDKKLAFFAIIGALPFVIFGAFITTFIPQSILYFMIAALLVVSVILVMFKRILKERRLNELNEKHVDYSTPEGEHVHVVDHDSRIYDYCRTKSGYKKRFFGYGIGGFFQGAAGFGIGELGIISMILSNIPTRIAIGTSHFVVAGTAIVASFIHIMLSTQGSDPIPWNLPFVTVPAVMLGGQLAPYLAAKLPTKLLEKTIAAIFVVIAGALVVLALG